METAAAVAAVQAHEPDERRADRRDIDFVTLDPPGARDLDQAFAIERRPDGWRVFYAVADVATFVSLGDAIDDEARRRGVTLYLPDARVPLHPPALSEGAASLLPGVDRPALLWQLDTDDAGGLQGGRVRRALVRSRAQLDYPTVQRQLDDGVAPAPVVQLREVGLVLQEAERHRGGVSLPLPEQIVERTAAGGYRLALRRPLAVEQWNAQLSLLTGRAAANLMLTAGSGILRTLPPVDDAVADRLRTVAGALGVAWPDGAPAEAYPAFVRSLDPASPVGAALLHQSARALRGADYEAFDGTPPRQPNHSAVAAPYAHVTAPLRRLVDRFASEVAMAASHRVDVPDGLRAALPLVPELMARARQREGTVERAVVDLMEAVLLAGRVGSVLDAVVVDVTERGAAVQLVDPPVAARVARADGGDSVALGDAVTVTVVAADPATRTVRLRMGVR